MKTRFEILWNEVIEVDPDNRYIVDRIFSDYKNDGYSINEDQEVYKEFDRTINLNEGDRVYLNEYYIVKWKCHDIEKDQVIYLLMPE